MATVHPSLFYKSALWCHSYYGILELSDNNIATVFPLLSLNSGAWCHYDGTVNPFYASNMATVIPLLSVISYLCSFFLLGISPLIA